MKKLLFAAGILTFGMTSVFAQDVKPSTGTTSQAAPAAAQQMQMSKKMDPKMMATMKANRMEKTLALTPEQKAKVTDIFLNEKQDGNMRMAENPETEKQIKAVLTPDQVAKFDALKAQREAARQARMQQVQQQAPTKN
jgi:Spy/CpxP family protein refolding chaperone